MRILPTYTCTGKNAKGQTDESRLFHVENFDWSVLHSFFHVDTSWCESKQTHATCTVPWYTVWVSFAAEKSIEGHCLILSQLTHTLHTQTRSLYTYLPFFHSPQNTMKISSLFAWLALVLTTTPLVVSAAECEGMSFSVFGVTASPWSSFCDLPLFFPVWILSPFLILFHPNPPAPMAATAAAAFGLCLEIERANGENAHTHTLTLLGKNAKQPCSNENVLMCENCGVLSCVYYMKKVVVLSLSLVLPTHHSLSLSLVWSCVSSSLCV